jgi:hypothetical protein
MLTSLSLTLNWCSMNRHVSGITWPSSGGTTRTQNRWLLCTVVDVGWSQNVGRLQSSHILRPTHIYNCTQYSPNLRPCSASWRWPSNARNMSRHWTPIKCKLKWSVYQVGCVYYVITSQWRTVNKTPKNWKVRRTIDMISWNMASSSFSERCQYVSAIRLSIHLALHWRRL